MDLVKAFPDVVGTSDHFSVVEPGVHPWNSSEHLRCGPTTYPRLEVVKPNASPSAVMGGADEH